MKNRKNFPNQAPRTSGELLTSVRECYESLSSQLKKIAHYVESNGQRLAFDGVQETATKCGVQPSAVIRFAKQMGLSGFTEMQALFRADTEQQISAHQDYHDRIRTVLDRDAAGLNAKSIAQEVMRRNLENLQALQMNLADSEFDQAMRLLADAKSIWIVANRRAFPVGAYLAYSLRHTEKHVNWLNGLGHMQHTELLTMTSNDVLIAVTFAPYADETKEVVLKAHERGAKVVAITDSKLGPVAQVSSAVLLAQDAATYGFRSLTSAFSVAQSLFIGLAYELESKNLGAKQLSQKFKQD